MLGFKPDRVIRKLGPAQARVPEILFAVDEGQPLGCDGAGGFLVDTISLWDERFVYVDRPTEIEGYAVAIEEGRRLGMTSEDIADHLAAPWMTADDTTRLLAHVDGFLATGVLPNLGAAKIPAPRRSRRPW
ncbi:MAG TPA: hypothetical protein VJ860_23760 [Polyangia bacterium]|nr:hypothetical protein [Polyangia bacterium]